MNKQTRNTTMGLQLGHEPILDEFCRSIPLVNICPRCSVHCQLLLGLKKTPPVCIDCALDPTFTNVQENWGEEGVIVHQGQEIHGHIAPSQIIIQHPKYTVFEQFHDRELVLQHNYSGRSFHLPGRNRKAFNVAKSEMPNLRPIPVLKTSAQNMGGLDEHRKTSQIQENSCPLLTSLLLANDQAQSPLLTFSNQHAEPPGSIIGEVCTALHQGKAKETGINQPEMQKSSNDKSNMSASFHAKCKQATLPNLATSTLQLKPATKKAKKTRVTQPCNYQPGKIGNATVNFSSQKNKAKLNDCRFAHERNSSFREFHNEATTNAHKANSNQMGVDLLNIQQVHNLHCSGMCWCALTNPSLNSAVELSHNCCVPGCGTSWISNRDISQIQGHSMSACTPIAPFSDLRIREEHALPPEGAVRQFRVPEESIRKIEPANQISYALSSCYPNRIISYMLDEQDALLKPATSTELNTPPKCSNHWPYNVVQNNIIQTDAGITKSKLFDQRRTFCSNMANPMMLVDPIIHEHQVEQSHATHSNFSMTTQEKQMDTETLATQQNLENKQEFVKPQPLPRHAISTEQEGSPREALDLTYKFETKEDHTQRNAAKPSNREMCALYPKSIRNSDSVIAELSSTPTAQPKPLEGLNMAKERQGNCSEIEAEKTSKQQVLQNSYPYSIFNLPNAELLVNSVEQVKAPEKKIERANIMAGQENCIQVKIEKACNDKMDTQLVTSASCVKTPQQAAIVTCKTEAQEIKEETRQSTNVDTSPFSNTQIPQFETLEDLMNAFCIASRNTAQSNMEKDMGSDVGDELYIVQPFPKISNPEFTFQDNTCGISKFSPQNKNAPKMADFAEIGAKLVQNDSCVTLQEQVIIKETGSKLEQSSVQDDGTRNGSEKGTKPRIQKALRTPLKRSRERNEIDCDEFGGNQSGAEESECTEASMSKYQPKEGKVLKTSESITRGGKDLTGSTECKKTSRDDATDSASSPIEVEPVSSTRDESKNQAKEKTHELRKDFPCQSGTVKYSKELQVKLSDIACCQRRRETFADAVGKAAKSGVTSQSGPSHASKIVDLLVKQHEDWRDWNLEIDGKSGLVLRNGKSVSSAESLPVDLDSNDNAFKKNLNKKTTTVHPQVVAKMPRTQEEERRESKSPDRKGKGKYLKLVKVSQDPKRQGTLQLNKVCSVSEYLAQNVRISKEKRHLKMKGMLKRANCHVRKMYFTENENSRHFNRDKKDNLTYSFHPSNSKKAGMNPKEHIPVSVQKKKQWPHQQVSKRGNSNNCDSGRTVLSGKISQDLKRQSTLQMSKGRPEVLPKSASAKRVRKSMKKYMEMERKTKLPTKMAARHVRNLQELSQSKGSGQCNQDEGNCGCRDRADGEEETIPHQDLPQCSRNLKMFRLKDEKSHKPARLHFSPSAKAKGIEKTSKASPNKNYKIRTNPKTQFPPEHSKIKYQTPGHASKGERSNTNDNRAQSPLQINQRSPEEEDFADVRANGEEEALSSQDLRQCLIVLDKIHLRQVSEEELKPARYNSANPKSEERSADVISKKDVDRAIPLFDLVISRVVNFRRKGYSNKRNMRQSKATRPRPPSVDPNTYHANIEFTNPEYIAMCKRIEDLMEKEKFVDIIQVSNSSDRDQTFTKKCTITSRDELKDLQSLKAKSQPQPDPEYTTMCKGKDNSMTEDKAPAILPLVIPQDVENVGDQKKPRTSQDKPRDSDSHVITDVKHASRRREKCSEKQKHSSYCKALSILEFERDKERLLKRQCANPPDYSAKKQITNREPKIKCDINKGTPQGRTERTSLPSPTRQNRFSELDRRRNAKESEMKDPRMRSNTRPQNTTAGVPERQIQVCVFDRNNQRINSNTEERLDSWHVLWIRSVPRNGQKSTQTQDKSGGKKQSRTTLLSDGASLGFREGGFFTQSMRRWSFPEFSFRHRNDRLNITVYSHEECLWASVKELSESGTFQRDKCFIALPHDVRGHYEDVFGGSNESFYYEESPINQMPHNYKRRQEYRNHSTGRLHEQRTEGGLRGLGGGERERWPIMPHNGRPIMPHNGRPIMAHNRPSRIKNLTCLPYF